jgi:cysteine desulfurase
MPERVYLDWNATTPLRPEAKAAMAAAWDISGNPSSVHAEGRQARRLVEEARASVAGAVGGRPQDVVFSSGGTEANALALTPGLRRGAGQPVERLLVSAIEHASVLSGDGFRLKRSRPSRSRHQALSISATCVRCSRTVLPRWFL